jgi:putative SOS response-associated peptidase YedK
MSLGGWAAGTAPPGAWPAETYPGYLAPILVPALGDGGQGADVGEILLARFGLIPRWCRDAAHAAVVSRGTYNARTESVTDKPSFRSAWADRRWALVPMQDYFEPCWETGRSVRWRIARADGEPLLAAALHEQWADPSTRERVHSFTLLTRNADTHPVLRRMHRPGDEKRQLCMVSTGDASAWLTATANGALPWLLQREQPELTGAPAPLREDPQATLPF